MRTLKEIEYVGLIKNDTERETFFQDVLDTMIYDTCGYTHATGTAINHHCTGCGECQALRTYGLVPRRLNQ